jgi:hypothetical protein
VRPWWSWRVSCCSSTAAPATTPRAEPGPACSRCSSRGRRGRQELGAGGAHGRADRRRRAPRHGRGRGAHLRASAARRRPVDAAGGVDVRAVPALRLRPAAGRRTVESAQDLRDVIEAVGADAHVVVRLEAEPETLRRRIVEREPETFAALERARRRLGAPGSRDRRPRWDRAGAQHRRAPRRSRSTSATRSPSSCGRTAERPRARAAGLPQIRSSARRQAAAAAGCSPVWTRADRLPPGQPAG